MRILIDADGCPVVDETVDLARKYGLECLILCDSAHHIEREGATTQVLTQGADSVDFALVNLARPGDIIVTQDYALAAMGLARRARPIDQNGRGYTDENIDALLMKRHVGQKTRRAGGRLKGPPKRRREQDEAFVRGLTQWIEEGIK